MKIKDVLVVAAMPEELQSSLEEMGVAVAYTGLGKVNATYKLMQALAARAASGEKIHAVINFGTAGSSVHSTHDLVEVTQFVQRDMDVSPLGIARGVTPFDSLPAVLKVPKRLSNLKTGACGTGDNFEVSHPETPFQSCDDALDAEQQVSFFDDEETPKAPSLLLPYYDLVDMECYALAKVCEQEGIAFCSVKYISDGADASATNDWKANLPKAAAAFARLLPEILNQI